MLIVLYENNDRDLFNIFCNFYINFLIGLNVCLIGYSVQHIQITLEQRRMQYNMLIDRMYNSYNRLM